jgi:hypothetical protein
LKKRQYRNLVDVLKLVCLHQGVCIHQKLELLLVNQFTNVSVDSQNHDVLYELENSPDRCKDSCWQCRKLPFTKELELPISKAGLRASLVDIFIHQASPIEKKL